jgi:hypothetical protein
MPSKKAELTELKALIALAQGALERNDQDGLNAALDKLRRFARNSLDPQARRLANDALDAANNANMAAGIAELASVVARLDAAASVLDEAAAGAAKAKEDLFFPKAARSAEKILGKLTKLKQDVGTLEQTLKEEAQSLGTALDDIKELEDIPEALEKLEAALQRLRDKKKGSKT